MEGERRVIGLSIVYKWGSTFPPTLLLNTKKNRPPTNDNTDFPALRRYVETRNQMTKVEYLRETIENLHPSRRRPYPSGGCSTSNSL